MSNEWEDLLGAEPSAPPKKMEPVPTPEPHAQDDDGALFSAETHQAVRDGAERAKATAKRTALTVGDKVKHLVSTARLERINRRLEQQAAHAEGQTPRTSKTLIYAAVGVALIGGLAVGGWLHLRKTDRAPVTKTHAGVEPTPAPIVVPVPVEPQPVADPIADLDEPTPKQASPTPTAPAPQAKPTPTPTAVEVAKPLPPKRRPKAEPAKRDAWNSDQANKQLDEFFNQH